jgi:ATP-dependent Lhr-like helicase
LRSARLEQAPTAPAGGTGKDVLEILESRGAQFRSQLPALTRRLPEEVDEGIWDLVSRGLVHADAYSAVRSLLSARRKGRTATGRRLALGAHRAPADSGVGEGRWSTIEYAAGIPEPLQMEQLAERVAEQLVVRWGIVTYELFAKESYRLPWRHVAWALRRLEAKGEVLGGRFVEGLAGEQYALPEALDMLARPASGTMVTVAACDPLNLTGGVVSATRVPARVYKTVTLVDGEVVDLKAGG